MDFKSYEDLKLKNLMESNTKKLKDLSTINLSLKLWFSLNEKRKLQFFVYLIFILISSFAEVISIASVIPLLSVLSEPEKCLIYH